MTAAEVIQKLISGPSSRYYRAHVNGYVPEEWATRPIHAMRSPMDPGTLIVNISAETPRGAVVGARGERVVGDMTEAALLAWIDELACEMRTKIEKRSAAAFAGEGPT